MTGFALAQAILGPKNMAQQWRLKEADVEEGKRWGWGAPDLNTSSAVKQTNITFQEVNFIFHTKT